MQNVTVDSHVSIVRPKENKYALYLGQLIMSRESEIESMASGSTGQTELSRERLGKLKILCPDNTILQNYSSIIEPIMKKKLFNKEESFYLAALRDTLLPKLMSGAIEVPIDDSVT